MRFGVSLGGLDPYHRNADELFAPASTSKLFTAGAALARLGPDFRYATILRWRQNGARASSVELIGSGDPTWGMPQFGEGARSRLDSIAKALRASGVSEISGEPSLSANDGRWAVVSVPEGWKTHDRLSCGGALAQAFNISLNCSTYNVYSATSGSWSASGLRLRVEHKVSPGNSTSLSMQVIPENGRFRYVLSGTFKKGDRARSFTLPVYDTLPWAKALFRQSLEAQGIRILPAGSFGEEEERIEAWGQKSYSSLSPPLSEILKPFLKNSVNFLGDALLKSLAASESAPLASGLLEPGLESMRAYLLGLGLPRDFVLHDGSGLSRTSRASPRMLFEFLDRLQREPFFSYLWQGLAVAGVDGTLRNRMKGTPAQGKLRGKTGTLDGVYNLAGYVPHGRDYAPFVILTRTTSGYSGTARAAEDRVGAALAGLHRYLFMSEEGLPEPYMYVPEQAGLDDQ